jgi:RNA polymerase sigma-70 factor (ECF subfamily)
VRDYESLTDEELWSRAAASHDSAAFGELFERHADAVYNHCFRRTASWFVAEDLTSVVFLEAWRKRRQVAFHGESVLPWLFGVANNAIRNATRSMRRHNRLLAKLPRPSAIPDQSEEAIGRVDDERAMQAILRAFTHLSVHDQEVISVCDWSGLSYEEAALALRVPVGTVRSRLSRARTRLRNLLDEDQVSKSPSPPKPPERGES